MNIATMNRKIHRKPYLDWNHIQRVVVELLRVTDSGDLKRPLPNQRELPGKGCARRCFEWLRYTVP